MSQHIGVLSDREIREEIEEGNIILYDPNKDCKDNIRNSSVDITLGEFYFRNETDLEILNPWCEEHVSQYWGSVRTADTVNDDATEKMLGIKKGEKYIILAPGESILGHTNEFIGGRNNVTSMMKCRSSLGRVNITICRDAGWGDVNFYNKWCLEITNNGTCKIVLQVGKRVGQVVFLYTGLAENPYNGKYHNHNNDGPEETFKNWTPSMLLPKLHLEDD